MKNIKYILLFFSLLSVLSVRSQADRAYPDPDGFYLYFANLKVERISSDINKEAFLTYILNNDKKNEINYEDMKSKIHTVEKAFPTAVTPFLQQAVLLKSKDANLDVNLKEFNDVFKLVEKYSYPKLIQESNDYHHWSSFWGADNQYHDLVRTDEAWDLETGDSRILIGISDTELDIDHEDLVNNISLVLSNNLTPSCEDGDGCQSQYHGTGVSGVAVAQTDNGKGIASIARESKVVFARGKSYNNVLLLAQTPGVRVINCSWGSCSSTESTNLATMYAEIRDVHNVIVVAGAGNGWSTCETGGPTQYFWPANHESVIGVTSISHMYPYGNIWHNPNTGVDEPRFWKDCHEQIIGETSTTHQHNDRVNICAPGYAIYTTWNDYAHPEYNNNRYKTVWGTSFASPITASACALVAAMNPCLSASEIQDIVLTTADASIYSIPENQPYIGQLGTGRLDVYEAVNRANELGTVFVQNHTFSPGFLHTRTAETSIVSGNNVTSSTSTGDVKILSGAFVEFHATHEVLLKSGFEVQIGGDFKVFIDDSSCF